MTATIWGFKFAVSEGNKWKGYRDKRPKSWACQVLTDKQMLSWSPNQGTPVHACLTKLSYMAIRSCQGQYEKSFTFGFLKYKKARGERTLNGSWVRSSSAMSITELYLVSFLNIILLFTRYILLYREYIVHVLYMIYYLDNTWHKVNYYIEYENIYISDWI